MRDLGGVYIDWKRALWASLAGFVVFCVAGGGLFLLSLGQLRRISFLFQGWSST